MGGSVGKSKSSSKVKIPKFLRPLVGQAANTSQMALGNLSTLLSGGADNLVADFTGQQELAQILGTQRALGGGGFFPTAQDTILNAAQGQGLSFVPDSVLNTLQTSSRISPEVLRLLEGGNIQGLDVLQGLTGGALPGSVVDRLSQNGLVPGQDQISAILERNAIPPGTIEQLQRTANGDFLFGGEGFDQAVQAAVRAATPGLISAFGRGTGGGTGGLAQTAIAQAGIDAFANQFANERQNQIGAQNTLANLGLAERGQSADIAGMLADLGLSSNAQNISAANILGNLSLADTGQSADIAGMLANLGINIEGLDQNAAQLLGNLDLANRGQNIDAASILGSLAQFERGNQLDAAALLPELATADVELLRRIGAERQDLNQRRLTAPIDAQLQLLAAAMGGLPISSFLGQSGQASGFQLKSGG